MEPAVADVLRLFIAAEVPAAVKAELERFQQRLKTGAQFTGAYPTWVEPENLHLTLAFLGNQPLSRVSEIEAAMLTAARTAEAFRLRFKGLELFPNPKAPKVLSIEILGQLQRLAAVQEELVKQLRTKGFELEDRPFRPHLTMARIKSAKGLAGLRDLARSHSSITASEFDVTELVLFKSVTGPDGPKYEVVARHPLPPKDLAEQQQE